jgi:hypothetical protein
VLRIFGPKREDGGTWRKLHNDDLHSMMRAGYVARMGEGRGVYRILMRRPEGDRPLGRPRSKWEDKINLDVWVMGIDGANWIQLSQDRVQRRAFVNMMVNLQVP